MKKIGFIICSVVLGSLVWSGSLRADGKETFDKNCKACHGADGKGSATMSTGLKVEASLLDLTQAATKGKPDADLVKIITDGKEGSKMTGFGKKLTADQIKELVTFVKGL